MPSFPPSSSDVVTLPPLADAASGETESCPQCAAKLIDPNGLGWCRACGYCRSLEVERKSRPLQRPALPTPSSPMAQW